jgi:hypothetical protein
VLALASALVWVTGCTNFQDPSTVVDLRVLAVATEPPEIILDVDLSDPTMPVVNPASNPPVTVTPLIIDPAGGGRPVTYTILGCPNNPFGASPPAGMGGGGFPSGGARTTVGSALCDESSPNTWALVDTPVPAGTSATVQLSPEQLAAAFRADLFPDQYGNLHGGFDLGEPLTLQIRVDADGEKLDVVKRVLYWGRRIDDAQMPNQIPVSGGLTTYPDREPNTAAPVAPISPVVEGMPFPVPAGSHPYIEPAPALAEPYETTVVDPDTHQAVPLSVPHEIIRYTFYATAGTFDPLRTSSELAPGFTGTVHLESKYNAPADPSMLPVDADGRHIVTIWVVVRDDRGGESWLERTLEITAP